ncbi:FI18412p1 [Strongyloides ratti]|uniref:FI18412p1 n=1 Tax=Strongyloides ratti TaxID=34506 RepID=A0A090MYL6_STRRB|nr:FI18412p1 [Strongyloides ratti]CEF67399.1 FI18412p1 [Strongyloides ratti]
MDPLPPVQLMPAKRLAMTQEEFDAKFEFLKNRQQPKKGSISTLELQSDGINFSQFFKSCFNLKCDERKQFVRTSVVEVINHGKDGGVLSEIGSGNLSSKSLNLQHGNKVKNILSRFIPLFGVLSKYSIKESLLQDIIGGLIVGIHAAGEGLPLAFLGGISPISGLYTCFIAFIMNVFFGKKNCEGFGVNIIIMYIVKQVIERLTSDKGILEIDNNNLKIMNLQMEIMSTLTLMISVILLTMLFFNFHFLIEYLPKHLISGMTFGIIIKVFLSQIHHLVHLPQDVGIKNITITCLNSTKDCSSNFNIYTISISISCFVIIFVIQKINKILLKPLFSIRISIFLFLIIFASLLSRKIQLKENYSVEVLSNIQSPLRIIFPKLYLVPYLIFDSIILSLISFSIYHTFSKKYFKEFDDSQRYNTIILCLTNIFSTFFGGVPSSYFNEKSISTSKYRKRSSLTFLVASIFLIPCIYFSNFLFSSIPICVLSCISIISSIDSIFEFSKIFILWNSFRSDFCICIVTTIFVIFYHNISYSIFYSSIFAVTISIIRRIQTPNIHTLINVTGSGAYYEEKGRYDTDFFDYDNGIAVVRFEGPLLYNNASTFKKSIFRLAERIRGNIQPIGIGTRTPSMKSTSASAAIQSQRDTLCIKSTLLISGDVVPTFDFLNVDNNKEITKVLVLDSLTIVAIDSIDKGIKIYFANMSPDNRELFEACNAYSIIPKGCFFPSIHDAVLSAHQMFGNCPPNIHMSVSMHGCRDLITLSTTPSNQNINDDQQSKQDFIGSSGGGGGGRDSSVPSSTPRPSLQEHKLCIREINKDNPLQVLRATISNG